MTDQQHPIIPSPELFDLWRNTAPGDAPLSYSWHLVTQAARWGADRELEACCEWLQHQWKLTTHVELIPSLRKARRPKPPSLAEEALQELERTVILLMPVTGPNKVKRFAAIRRALERLQELENND